MFLSVGVLANWTSTCFLQCCIPPSSKKWGLPHRHILVWRKWDKGEIGVESIESFISFEIPNPLGDPLGYVSVSEFMMHGQCSEMDDKCICMKKCCCSKYFPKLLRDSTIIDEHGFALYRRRDDGRTIYKNGHYLNNRLVVPYNMTFYLECFKAI